MTNRQSVPDAPLVMSVTEAGTKLGLGRNSSYAAAARGEIPTIRIGGLLKVPIAAFHRMLDRADGSPRSGADKEFAAGDESTRR
jgi:hypothetical protein